MTETYAIVGNPVQHSLSPQIHRLFAEQTAQPLTYTSIEMPLDGFEQGVTDFFAGGGCGLNVTVPFKLRACQLAQCLLPRARAAGAANTLWLAADQKLVADNTDGLGLVADIRDRLQWPLAGKKLLLLGAGGAARGVLAPLLAELPAAVHIANRTAGKAAELAQLFAQQGPLSASGFADLPQRNFDVLVNATSAGLTGALPPIAAGVFSGACVYDMLYGRQDTALLQQARACGAVAVADGLGMLVGQAAESFAIWRGVKPDVAPVIAALRAQLA